MLFVACLTPGNSTKRLSGLLIGPPFPWFKPKCGGSASFLTGGLFYGVFSDWFPVATG